MAGTGQVMQEDGEVYVIGRQDDAIIVGGRNLYPQDIEEIAYAHPCIRDGRSVAFGLDNPDLGTKDLVVVAEVNDESDLEQRRQIVAEIREQILAEIGVSPRTIYLVSPKWVVKSTAGKSARSTDLPPGTSPLSKLDLGPFEVHSMV